MFVDQQSQLKNTINTQYHKRMKLQHKLLYSKWSLKLIRKCKKTALFKKVLISASHPYNS